jgi:DNA-binding NarL/FixJ family response regulator
MSAWSKLAAPRPGDRLTPRELDVLEFVAAGHSTPQVAARLGIAPVTIKTHLTSVPRKVGAQNRVQATRHYLDRFAA